MQTRQDQSPAPRPVTTTAPPPGVAVQTMDTKYATAVRVQSPRDINEVERKCLEEAAKAGESMFYAWGVGKDHIEGPSVDCAMIAARNWGNCAIPAGPMIETVTAYIFTASFVDLETGYTIDRQFRQSKNWTVFGKMDEERKADVRFQIGASKAARNVILKALPAWLIDHMIARAKEGVREKIDAYVKKDGIVKAREMTLRALTKHGVTEDQVAAKFGKKTHEWEIEDLVILKGCISAIESGQESASVIFPSADAAPDDATPPVEPPKPTATRKATRAPEDAAPTASAPKPTATRQAAPAASKPANGAKQKDDPTAESRDTIADSRKRIDIQKMAAKLSTAPGYGGDVGKIIGDWTGGIDLLTIGGDDLDSIYEAAISVLADADREAAEAAAASSGELPLETPDAADNETTGGLADLIQARAGELSNGDPERMDQILDEWFTAIGLPQDATFENIGPDDLRRLHDHAQKQSHTGDGKSRRRRRG